MSAYEDGQPQETPATPTTPQRQLHSPRIANADEDPNCSDSNSKSILNKIHSRVSNILPDSVAKWFSPVPHSQQQLNGFDVDDGVDADLLDYGDVELADQIAEHDALEDEEVDDSRPPLKRRQLETFQIESPPPSRFQRSSTPGSRPYSAIGRRAGPGRERWQVENLYKNLCPQRVLRIRESTADQQQVAPAYLLNSGVKRNNNNNFINAKRARFVAGVVEETTGVSDTGAGDSQSECGSTGSRSLRLGHDLLHGNGSGRSGVSVGGRDSTGFLAHHNSTGSLNSLSRRKFNACIYGSTSALSDSRLLTKSGNSPFYPGPTAFGGLSANNRTIFGSGNLSISVPKSTADINSILKSPNFCSSGMKPVIMRPEPTPDTAASPLFNNPALSTTARNILNLLKNYSTPLIDVQKLGRTLHEQQQQRRVLGFNRGLTPYTRPTLTQDEKAAAKKLRPTELLVPTMQELLERRRLQRVTISARETMKANESLLDKRVPSIVSAPSKPQIEKTSPSSASSLQSVTMPSLRPSAMHTNKMRSRLSHHSARKEARDEADHEPPIPLDLPNIAFPDMRSTPKFDLVIPVLNNNNNNNNNNNIKSNNTNINSTTTDSDTKRTSRNGHLPFQFREPIWLPLPDIRMEWRMGQPTINPRKYRFSLPLPLTPKSNVPKDAPVAPVEAVTPKPPRQGIGVEQPKAPTPLVIPLTIKRPANSWECDVCMIVNKSCDAKCVACEAPNPKAPAVTGNNVSSSTSATVTNNTSTPSFKFGFQANDMPKVKPDAGFEQLVAKQKAASWNCDACLAQNDMSRNSCICCEQLKPGVIASAISNFRFGASATSGSPSAPVQKFSFGAVPASTASETTKTTESAPVIAPLGFKFGAPAADTIKSPKPIFSSSLNSVSPGPIATTGMFKRLDAVDNGTPTDAAAKPMTTAGTTSSSSTGFVFGAASTATITTTTTTTTTTTSSIAISTNVSSLPTLSSVSTNIFGNAVTEKSIFGSSLTTATTNQHPKIAGDTPESGSGSVFATLGNPVGFATMASKANTTTASTVAATPTVQPTSSLFNVQNNISNEKDSSTSASLFVFGNKSTPASVDKDTVTTNITTTVSSTAFPSLVFGNAAAAGGRGGLFQNTSTTTTATLNSLHTTPFGSTPASGTVASGSVFGQVSNAFGGAATSTTTTQSSAPLWANVSKSTGLNSGISGIGEIRDGTTATTTTAPKSAFNFGSAAASSANPTASTFNFSFGTGSNAPPRIAPIKPAFNFTGNSTGELMQQPTFNFTASAATSTAARDTTPNAEPFQFNAGFSTPSNIFAFNPPAGNAAQNALAARRKIRAPTRRLPPR